MNEEITAREKALLTELDYRNSLLLDCYVDTSTLWRWLRNRRRLAKRLDWWMTRQRIQNTWRIAELDHLMEGVKE